MTFDKNRLYKILDYWSRDNPANICWSSRRLQDVFWRRLSKENIFVLIKTSSEGEDERRVQDVFIKTNVCWKTQFWFFRKGSGNGFSNVWIFRKNVFHVIFYSLSDCLYFLSIGQYQKQPSRGVFKKRRSENIQQIYRRTPMPKCDLQSNFIESALRHGCSPVNLLHIFRTVFPKNTSGRLLLQYVHCNCSFSSLCRHIFWNQPYLSNQIVFLPEQKIKTKFKYMSRTKRAFKMKQEAFFIIFKELSLVEHCIKPGSATSRLCFPLIAALIKLYFWEFVLL